MALTPKQSGSDADALIGGDRRALARAISAVENETAEATAVFQAIQVRGGHAQVIGITGAPGAGKSTLLAACIGELRRQGRTVGVIAVDPSSPFSGGAILGDRIRMTAHGTDPGVFIRSLASRGHLGGLSRTTSRVVDVMDAAGLDVVIVETVGTGQSEVEIMELAQTVVVVCAPGLGDEIQAVKAGILEIAHVLVVAKADTKGAARIERQLAKSAALASTAAWTVPVLKTVAIQDDGIAALIEAIGRHYAQLPPALTARAAGERMAKLIATTAARLAQDKVAALPPARLADLCRRVQGGRSNLETAAIAALKAALKDDR